MRIINYCKLLQSLLTDGEVSLLTLRNQGFGFVFGAKMSMRIINCCKLLQSLLTDGEVSLYKLKHWQFRLKLSNVIKTRHRPIPMA